LILSIEIDLPVANRPAGVPSPDGTPGVLHEDKNGGYASGGFPALEKRGCE